jgi:hypothetical protein
MRKTRCVFAHLISGSFQNFKLICGSNWYKRPICLEYCVIPWFMLPSPGGWIKWQIGVFKVHTPGGCWKLNFWTARVKSIKYHIVGILASRAIDWYMYGSNWRGGGLGFGGVPQFFCWPLPQNFNIPSESSAPSQSIGTLFEQIG